MCSGDRLWRKKRTLKDLEHDGKRTICTWDVGLSPRKKQSKEVGDSTDAKVFKAHGVPLGLCALKLLANQQEDGDGLLQNIVKNLSKESRKVLRTACVNSQELMIMSAP